MTKTEFWERNDVGTTYAELIMQNDYDFGVTKTEFCERHDVGTTYAERGYFDYAGFKTEFCERHDVGTTYAERLQQNRYTLSRTDEAVTI